MSLETRINGRLIGVAHIENTEVVDGEKNYLYNVRYIRVTGNPAIIEFDVLHKREDGAEALALLIYKEIDKELKKRK